MATDSSHRLTMGKTYIEDIQVFGVNMSFISLSEVKIFFILWQVMKYREIRIKYNQYLKKLYFHM